MTHAENALAALENATSRGDSITVDPVPVVTVDLAVAQVEATLAVAGALERIADRLDKVVYVANANAV